MLGGSIATGQADAASDIDLYVYVSAPISIADRRALIDARSSAAQFDNRFWEHEDYWVERASGTKAEAIYRDTEWPPRHLRDLLSGAHAQMGCTTSLWHNFATSRLLVDRSGWGAALQREASAPYPDALVQAIVRKNWPLLEGSMAAYPAQLTRALETGDTIFALNRVNALLDSYFDVLFAINRTLHPGSKRQLRNALVLKQRPASMAHDVQALVYAREAHSAVAALTALIDGLRALLPDPARA